jgi:predicted transposase YbfD/YdcC
VPVLLSSLIDVPADELPAVLAAGDDTSCCCLRDWLARVPDPRSRLGRWHPLEFVLALAICAFTAAGHDSPAAIAEWAAGCCQTTLAILSGRRDPWARRIRPPGARTFSRVFARIDAGAFNAALYGYLAAMPASPPDALPAVTRHEREQRRAARAAASPGLPGLLEQAAADGKTVRGAVRPDGSQVHLLSVFDVGTGCVRAQREVDAKTNEIPELAPAIAHLDLTGTVVTADALHTQAETARHLVEDKHAHYLMIIKANQPTLLESAVKALAGPDAGFAGASRAEEGKGHGRRERRAIRTAPADGIAWPHAAQVMRIRRDTGPTHGPWTHKEIAYGITSLPPDLAGPRHLAIYVRNHWAVENREHYVRDKTFSEDLQQVRTGNQPNAYAAIRNLVTGAFRRAGFANIAHARRYYGRDDQRILTLYGYT